ncbi:hypothetical protein FOL47_004455 [Perkinsus chesapeaki]|uniref:Uncharacterized protein n=1 Tax=Perkinsus chesapeaki TaxID=330153 RepID=A0A7J6M2L9_PERCH|nr:hypothetical protein FOL47_004455 [Perkinsus chesapeaki]
MTGVLSPIPPRPSRFDSLTRSAVVFPVSRPRRSSIHFPSPSVVGRRRSSLIGSTKMSPSSPSVSQVLLPTQSAIPIPPASPYFVDLSQNSYVPRGHRSSVTGTNFLAPSRVDTIYSSSPPARISRVVTRIHSPHGRSPPKEFTTTYSNTATVTSNPPSPADPPTSSSKAYTMFITP